jgi:hypothetical protein
MTAERRSDTVSQMIHRPFRGDTMERTIPTSRQSGSARGGDVTVLAEPSRREEQRALDRTSQRSLVMASLLCRADESER